MSAQVQIPAGIEEARFAAACYRLDPGARRYVALLMEEMLELLGQGEADEVADLLDESEAAMRRR